MVMKIEYDIEGGIGRIQLSNPPDNRLDDPVFADADELASFLARGELRGVIVSGAGRHFSAGADLEELERRLAEGSETLTGRLDEGKRLAALLDEATVPVLASIRGSCLGAGLEIALACHFRIAAGGAMLGFPEAELGLVPGLGGTGRAPRAVGIGRAAELVISGRLVGAEEACEMGLVDRVVPGKELREASLDFIEGLTRDRSPELVRAAMTAIQAGRRLPLGEALEEESRIFTALARARAGRDDD